MTFDYEVENEDGEVVAVLSVTACFSEFVPARLSGHPDDWCPAEGGELEEMFVYLDNKDITKDVDLLFGDGTHEAIETKAIDAFDPKKEAEAAFDGPDPDDFIYD